jgi:DNA-binding response OmpR family regulator
MNAPRDQVAAGALKVMVVGDDADNLAVIHDVVSQLGYRTLSARDSGAAFECFEAHAPDLVLIAFSIGGVDGFEITARIRALQGSRWVPVIYVATQHLERGLIDAIEAGGDDYLHPPLDPELLRAKLTAVRRMLMLERENVQHRIFLERYYQQAEEEQQIAGPLMQRLVQVDVMREQAVQYRIAPACGYSGDVIAAARTPGGVLHVLLGDGTGHGLAASLGVMPVAQPFYAMTQKGFGLIPIAKEINRKIRDWLPIGRFVATTLIAIDPGERTIEVWNGGNPPAVMLDAKGAEIHRFASRHLPLGVLPEHELDLTAEQAMLSVDAQILVCSDGVIEAESPAGVQFGVERLIATAAAARVDQRMTAIDAALDDHLAGSKAHDDLSIALIDCGMVVRNEQALDGATSAGRSSPGLANWSFSVALSPNELRTVEVVPMFTAMLQTLGVAQAHRANLFLVLSELVNNALDHGVLRLDSALKSGPQGMERYLALRAKRLAMLTEGFIRVEIRVDSASGGSVLIRVQDSGQGFDWHGRSDGLTSTHHYHGRGVALVRRLCAGVDYLGCGNEVVARYQFGVATSVE